MGEHGSTKHLIKIHIAGGLICALIAGASVFFAGGAVSKRRGVLLNARHELASTQALFNDSAAKRASLSARVQSLEVESSQQIKLMSVKQLNVRTGKVVEIAESVGIRIDSLQPEERLVDQRVSVLPMRFIGSADADEVFEFLELMRDKMPDIHIHTIDLVSDSLDSSVVKVDILLYWFVDHAESEA